MKTNKRILKELKKSIEKNISIPTEWRYVVIKELNVGDVVYSIQFGNIGVITKLYFDKR